jgi:hypothetical protein
MLLDDIHSNHIQRCAVCGIPITVDNDSGWEIFVGDGKTTQPICAWCDVERHHADEDIALPKSADSAERGA